MEQVAIAQDVAFMQDLDRRFRAASGLESRNDYSIFYSRVRPARVMVIGIKPGGRRDGTHQLASSTFYEDWSHEYVDMDYRIAAVMRPTLMRALGAENADELRGVPKTNCFFHRAVGTDDFSSRELREHAELCAPFLSEMIAFVQPEVLILEGAGARELVARYQCRDLREDELKRVVGLRRGAINTFFRKETGHLRALDRTVTVLTLGHPSQFGHLPEWAKAVDALAACLGPTFLPQPHSTPSSVTAVRAERAVKPTLANMKATPFISKAASLANASVTRDARRFTAAKHPPESFRYSPIHDFWQELVKIGPIGVDAFYDHLGAIGWQRPSGRPLTPQIVRTDLVSMVKHGFASADR